MTVPWKRVKFCSQNGPESNCNWHANIKRECVKGPWQFVEPSKFTLMTNLASGQQNGIWFSTKIDFGTQWSRAATFIIVFWNKSCYKKSCDKQRYHRPKMSDFFQVPRRGQKCQKIEIRTIYKKSWKMNSLWSKMSENFRRGRKDRIVKWMRLSKMSENWLNMNLVCSKNVRRISQNSGRGENNRNFAWIRRKKVGKWISIQKCLENSSIFRNLNFEVMS